MHCAYGCIPSLDAVKETIAGQLGNARIIANSMPVIFMSPIPFPEYTRFLSLC